jgi:hypothetical protein
MSHEATLISTLAIGFALALVCGYVAARVRAEEKAAARRTFTPEELVERFPLFAGLTHKQREVLLLHFKPRTAMPGERVFRTGDAADGVYFISQGEVFGEMARKYPDIRAELVDLAEQRAGTDRQAHAEGLHHGWHGAEKAVHRPLDDVEPVGMEG